MVLSLDSSLSLAGIDPHAWDALTEIARLERMGAGELLALIDRRRAAAIDAGYPAVTLASAVRVFVVAYWRMTCPAGARAEPGGMGVWAKG